MSEENNNQETNQEEIAQEVAEAAEGLEEVKSDEVVEPEVSLEEKLKEAEEQNLRLLAEMQNIRNRHQKDMKEAREYATTSFAQDMIHVLENLNRAKESIPEEENEIFKSILEGINMTREEVIRIFGKHGIERVAPNPGEKFDYKVHQAVVQIPTEEFDEGCVVQLIQAGYMMKDRILKAAMVSVAKKPDFQAQGDSSDESDSGDENPQKAANEQ
jgi:molecular chaperone GrpE